MLPFQFLLSAPLAALPEAQALPEIFAMGGYGMYIWPCYGLLVIALSMLTYIFWRDRRYAYLGLKLEREYREKRHAELEKGGKP